MENDFFTQFENSIMNCSVSMFSFNQFINDAEDIAVQREYIFSTQAKVDEYHERWLQLEVLNACALADWENSGCPKEFTAEWELKYKHDADILLKELLCFVWSCKT